MRARVTFVAAFIVLAGLVSCSAIGAPDSIFYCGFVLHMRCSKTVQTNTVCGSNGVTYANECAFSKAKCKNSNLQVKNIGSCTPTTTTPGTTLSVSKSVQIAFDIFCLDLSKHNCATDIRQDVCGSNGLIYPSLCELDKHRCTHRHIQVSDMSVCRGSK